MKKVTKKEFFDFIKDKDVVTNHLKNVNGIFYHSFRLRNSYSEIAKNIKNECSDMSENNQYFIKDYQ